MTSLDQDCASGHVTTGPTGAADSLAGTPPLPRRAIPSGTIASSEHSERVEIANDPPLSTPENELVVDRLRIAFGVNDTVIRHLFSIGLDLHTTRTMVSDPVQVRLDATIDELDSAINELRTLIFDLERRASGDPVDARGAGHRPVAAKLKRLGAPCESVPFPDPQTASATSAGSETTS